MSSLKIVLTGATGFTGKRLLKRLQEQGYEIYPLVREKKGYANELVWDFIGPLPTELPSCDAVVHLAAYVDFTDIFHLKQFQVNTVSTMRLASYAKDSSDFFLFASMSGVHGNCVLIDKKTPLNPESNYGLSKYLGEQAIESLVKNYCIMRIGGIYGLDGPAHLGLNNAISQAYHQKTPPQLYGHGQAKRNYICVDDVADWMAAVLKRATEKAGKNRAEIVYVAGQETLSIEDYLQTIIDALLPGKQLTRTEGKDAQDNIVKPSLAPIKLRTFREYLLSLSTMERK